MRVAVLVGIVLIASVIAQKDLRAACAGKNSFLDGLKTNDPHVIIYEHVETANQQKPFSHCSYEWNNHGTCCESESLVRLFKYESKVIINNRNNLAGAVAKVIELIGKSPALKGKLKERTTKVTRQLKSTNSQCWDYMNKVRGSALCSICSGRSEAYFTSDKRKILVDPPTCKHAVDNCEGFFEAYLWLKKNVDKVTSKLGNFFIKIFAGKMIERVKKSILGSSPPEPLLKAFKEYLEYKDQKSKSELHSIKVCAMFLNVRYRPTYWDLSSFFGSSPEKLPTSKDTNKPKRLSKSKSAKSRSLGDQSILTLTSSASLLESDSSVLLKPSDSIYTSTFGADGTTTLDPSRPMMAVNMTLVFP